MLINLRNALMAGKRLPYDAEVEFLESTGTQYINTGIAGTNDLALEGDIYLSLSSGFSSNLPFGVKAGPEANDAQRCLAVTYNSEKWIYLQRGAYGYDGRAKVTVSQDGWHYMYLSKSKAVIDDTAATSVMPWNISPENSEPVHIFGFNNNGVANPAKARCRYFRIYDDGTLVRDYIPVRKGTVGYLYDRVSGKLFGNAGTGDFVVGQDVVPVEYLESHGTEYIDMGVAINTGTDTITSRFMPLTGISTYECLFGASESISGVMTCCELRKLQNTRDWYMLYPNSVGGLGNTLISTLADSAWHDVSVSNTGCVMDGVTIPYDVSTRQFTNNQYLFARNNNGSVAFRFKGRVTSYSITRSGADIRAMRAIRVGTEGAMMDVLTRRIYRNQGTGAFGYGNDLKYPIPSK